MQKYITRIYEIHPSSYEELISWGEHLRSQTHDALITLQEENMLIEGCELFTILDTHYCILYGLPGIQGLKEVDQTKALKVQHRDILKRALVKFISSTPAYFFSQQKIQDM